MLFAAVSLRKVVPLVGVVHGKSPYMYAENKVDMPNLMCTTFVFEIFVSRTEVTSFLFFFLLILSIFIICWDLRLQFICNVKGQNQT